MHLDFGGIEEIAASNERIRAFVMEAKQVASCIPDSQNFSKIDESHFTLDVKIGVGAVGGLFAMAVELKDLGQGRYLYTIRGRGSGSSIDIALNINVAGRKGNNAVVEWSSTADLKGIISGLGEQIIKQVTRSEIDRILENAKKKIEMVQG